MLVAVVLCGLFITVEMVGRLKANSLSIPTDPSHLLSDVVAFASSLVSLSASGWEATPRQSYGFCSSVILGAFLSIQMTWLLADVVVYNSLHNGSGAVLAISVYPLAEKKLGHVLVVCLAGALMIPIQMSYPFIANLSGLSLSLMLNCASILRNVLNVSAITGLLILQNRAVDQSQRGAANGIAMTAMSLFKTVGAVGAGILFSWSETPHFFRDRIWCFSS
ncbi:Protein ZINC INDUCED FACILITATOR 1 [Cardamine amara subsp. amara]|uniref:Protein ZINC INDUCED FACILITATOR 1 n=1 Tax=Cardamine amara subsp. amara TaxID=228776 RepID=A0ABD1A3D8_CARAN